MANTRYDQQEICLKGNGTWYGVTFTFSGRWVKDPASARDRAAIFGNYQVQGHDVGCYANDTITVSKEGGQLLVDWYDWYDDMSYSAFLPGRYFIRLKRDCDPPSTAENTHAATQ